VRALLIAVLLIVFCVPVSLAPSSCHAVAIEKPSCYPGRNASPRHAPRRKRVGAVHKAAVRWLREVIGSLTHSGSKGKRFETEGGGEPPRLWLTEFELRGRARDRDTRIIPTIRLDLGKERVTVGARLRF
jgi:hypothetical protein